MTLSGKEIVCPKGKPQAGTLTVNLEEISKIEARIHEVQVVTKEKAPELLSLFTIAWKDLHQNMVLLTKEYNDARRHEERVKGRLLLDEIPRQLKERDLINSRSPSGSADMREALLSQSEEYEQAQERSEYIQAVIELLKGKMNAFDMAFTSIKKIITDSSSTLYNKY